MAMKESAFFKKLNFADTGDLYKEFKPKLDAIEYTFFFRKDGKKWRMDLALPVGAGTDEDLIAGMFNILYKKEQYIDATHILTNNEKKIKTAVEEALEEYAEFILGYTVFMKDPWNVQANGYLKRDKGWISQKVLEKLNERS